MKFSSQIYALFCWFLQVWFSKNAFFCRGLRPLMTLSLNSSDIILLSFLHIFIFSGADILIFATNALDWFKFVNFLCLFKLQYVVTKTHPEGAAILSLCAHFWNVHFHWLFSSVFFQRRLKHFEEKTVSTWGKRWRPPISIWISLIFCGFLPHIFSYFHYCAISAGAANHRIRVDIHILIWETKNIWKCGRLTKSC